MLKRHDILKQAVVPELGKVETSYPSPNKADLVVIERIPIAPEKYRALPYHSPHPDFDNNGLFLVWQGKVRAENNQIAVVRIYANDLDNQEWFNATIKYAGEIITCPVYVRTYVQLRESYTPDAQASLLKKVMRLRVTSGGTYTPSTVPTAALTGGGGSGATASVIMNPAKTKVIALELTLEGNNYTSGPTVVFSGGAAAAVAEIQPTNCFLVHEETSNLDSEDPHMASMFIKVRRMYETLPGPRLVWDTYQDERGAIQRTSQSVLISDTTGQGTGSENASFTRNAGLVTKTWFEPRGDNALILTKFVETWTEVIVHDNRVTSEFGGGILAHDETTAEPGDQTVETGLLVTASATQTKSPHEQTLTTEKLDPASNNPVLELLTGGDYASAPSVTLTGGTFTQQATAHSIIAKPISSVGIANGGTGFITPPSIEFYNAIGGGALALCVLGYGVGQVIVTNRGSNYALAPTAVITGDGAGATIQPVVGFGIYFITVADSGDRGRNKLIDVSNVNPSNNDTVTIDGKIYTFKTAMPAVDGEIHIGANADATLMNLAAAINNAGGTTPQDYFVNAAHPTVSAAVTITAHTLTVFARQPGLEGNSIAIAEASSVLRWENDEVLLKGGMIYTEIPLAEIEGTGTGASATVVMGYPVGTINLTNPGSGYGTPPAVSVLLGNGDGLEAVAILNNGIDGIQVTNGGSGYEGPPVVVIGPPAPHGVQATAHSVVNDAGVITSIVIDNRGDGYLSVPAVSFVELDPLIVLDDQSIVLGDDGLTVFTT